MTRGFAPVVDGHALPDHPFHPNASAVNPDVPLIIGANRTEMTFQLRSDAAAFNLDDAGLRARVSRMLGDSADEVIEVYRDSSVESSPSEIFFLIASDARYVNPCTHIAERRAALSGGPVYNYYLTWQTKTRDGRLMTPHALDIPFVFDNTNPENTVLDLTTGSAEERALAEKVSDTWIEFARSGKPSSGKLPEWQTYNGDARPTMVLDNESRMVDDPISTRREIMSKALGL